LRAVRKPTADEAVLVSFQLEQRDGRVRIVDHDGSVYTGAVQVIQAPPPPGRAGEAPAAARAADKQATAYRTREQKKGLELPAARSPEALLFSVQGTNVTLRQAVVFVGNVQSELGLNQLRASNRPAEITEQFRSRLPVQNQLQNSRIFGRARLADGREWEINAVAAPDPKE
jgi:hypothetical protein